MLLYVFLAMIVVSAIITGIIVTIMDKRGLFPETADNKHKKKKSSHNTSKGEYTMSTGILISSSEEDGDEYYSIPVIVSSYTVDLSNVVQDIQKMDNVEKSQTVIKEEKVL